MSKEEEGTLVLLTRSSSLILVPFLTFSFNVTLSLSETATLELFSQVSRRWGRGNVDGASSQTQPAHLKVSHHDQAWEKEGALQVGWNPVGGQCCGDLVDRTPIVGQTRWCAFSKASAGG